MASQKPKYEPVTQSSMSVRYIDQRIASRMSTMNVHRARIEKALRHNREPSRTRRNKASGRPSPEAILSQYSRLVP